MNGKMKTSATVSRGALPLMNTAGLMSERSSSRNTSVLTQLSDLIQSHARRLENLALWKDRLDRSYRGGKDGDQRDADHLLRLAQALRDSGQGHADLAFFLIANRAVQWAEGVFTNDPELSRLDSHENGHLMPSEQEELDRRWDQRFDELEALHEQRVFRFLLAHGETEMADLYAHNREAFERRFEAGRRRVLGDKDVILTGAIGGVWGLVK